MGAVAPVAAVVTAIVPIVAGSLAQGPPGTLAWTGFALALVGVTLVSAGSGGTKGVGLGALAGLGFGVFLTLLREAGTGGATWWPLALSRGVSFLAVAAVALATRRAWRPPVRALPLMLGAMALDVAGNALYVLAAQRTRLDVAAVLSSFYPAATMVLAALVLREHIRPRQAVGAAMLLVAVALLVR
jgi:drug/metabolite transporter (DMT)-like permease